VFLGDSTTYGWGVPNEDTLPEQVAALLEHRILPLNLGVNGYATPQEVAAYEQARAELEDTPLVVLVVYPNDAVDRAFLWDDANGALYVDALPVPHAWKRWLWKSGLYRGLASWHGDRLAARGELDSREENLPALLAEVERLARLVDGDGRQLVVVHLPGMVELDPYPYSWLTVALAATCERLSVPFVDLLDAFLAERERLVAEYEDSSGERVDPLAYRNFLSRYWLVPGRDHHLDAAGNRVAASALAAALAPLLP
jgi:hypothetical protein